MMKCVSSICLDMLNRICRRQLCGRWRKPLVKKLAHSILKKSAAGLKSFDAEKEGFSFSCSWRDL